jgi:hypothetical protein
MTEAGIPFSIHYTAVKALATWAVETATPAVMKMIDKLIDPAGTQVIPGFTTTPLGKKDQDQNDLSGKETVPASAPVVPEVPASAPVVPEVPASAPVVKPEVKPEVKARPGRHPNADLYDIKESLKKRVEKLMRS